MGSHLTRRERRAILLISVLFFSLLISMFVVAAIALSPAGLARGGSETSLLASDQAAKSGIDWVRGRISKDPDWVAATPTSFTAPGLKVQEGSGQVVGWVQGANGWSRFRVRFNYQDGPASFALNSDNLDDPATPWTDMAFVSCNNLRGGSSRPAPLAQNGSSYSQATPWPTTQLTVPPACMLLSVEGATGPVSLSGGNPTGFSGAEHRRVVQTILKFGVNQPITPAGLMANGPLNIYLFTPSPVQLSSNGSDVARIRTKGDLSINSGVNSPNGDLRASATPNINPLTGHVTQQPDLPADRLFQIPASKVRTPSSPVTLPAGVWVVTNSGQVMYYNMNYADYALATSHPSGTPTSLPAGLTLSTPNPTATPKFTITATSDIKITGSGSVTDFALIPDGGAPQSANYGGVPSATPSASATTYTTQQWVNQFLWDPNVVNSASIPLFQAWATANWGAGTSDWYYPGYQVWNLPTGDQLHIPNSGNQLIIETGGNWNADNTLFMSTFSNSPSTISDLESALPMPGGALPAGSASASASATPGLSPSDLQLTLQGSNGPLVMANDGNIVIGSQIQGNGAALTSHANITLIGTSTELSSTPGAQLGLNLYAEGTITVDAYKLDSSGATFHGLKMTGVVYAWQGINLFLGTGQSSAKFDLTGAMIAYGGDPSQAPPAAGSSGGTNINAGEASIKYDPSYLADLLQGGPFVLEVVSWHEF